MDPWAQDPWATPSSPAKTRLRALSSPRLPTMAPAADDWAPADVAWPASTPFAAPESPPRPSLDRRDSGADGWGRVDYSAPVDDAPRWPEPAISSTLDRPASPPPRAATPSPPLPPPDDDFGAFGDDTTGEGAAENGEEDGWGGSMEWIGPVASLPPAPDDDRADDWRPDAELDALAEPAMDDAMPKWSTGEVALPASRAMAQTSSMGATESDPWARAPTAGLPVAAPSQRSVDVSTDIAALQQRARSLSASAFPSDPALVFSAPSGVGLDPSKMLDADGEVAHLASLAQPDASSTSSLTTFRGSAVERLFIQALERTALKSAEVLKGRRAAPIGNARPGWSAAAPEPSSQARVSASSSLWGGSSALEAPVLPSEMAQLDALDRLGQPAQPHPSPSPGPSGLLGFFGGMGSASRSVSSSSAVATNTPAALLVRKSVDIAPARTATPSPSIAPAARPATPDSPEVGVVGRFLGRFKRPVVESAGVGVVPTGASAARSSTSSQRDESWLGDRDLAFLDGTSGGGVVTSPPGHGRVGSGDGALFDGFADAPTSLAPTKSTMRWRLPGRATTPVVVDAKPLPPSDSLGDLLDAFGDAPVKPPLPRSNASFDPLDPLAVAPAPAPVRGPVNVLQPAPLLPRPPPSPTFGGPDDDDFGAFASFNTAPAAPPPLLPPPSGRRVVSPPPLPAAAPAPVAGSGLSRADLSFFDSL